VVASSSLTSIWKDWNERGDGLHVSDGPYVQGKFSIPYFAAALSGTQQLRAEASRDNRIGYQQENKRMLMDRTRASFTAALIVTVAGCDEDTDTIPRQEMRVMLTPTALIDGVDTLQLRMNPTLVTHDGKTEALLVDSTTTQVCTTDRVTGTVTCEAPTGTGWIDIWPIQRLNNLPDPLSYGVIVRDVLVDQGQYTSATISIISDANVDDSYVQLPDGRRCEVRLLAANGSHSIAFPLDLHFGAEEDWIITLRIDLTGTPPLDPEQCADGYDLYGAPASVEYAHNPRPIHG
jgi:hypothetical protein